MSNSEDKEKRSGSRKRKSEEPGKNYQASDDKSNVLAFLNNINKVMTDIDSSSPVVWPSWCYGSAENGGDDEKSPGGGNNAGGLNLNEKPMKRRRKDGGSGGNPDRDRGERSSPSESVQSDSEIGVKRSPPPPQHRNYSDFMRSLAAKYNHLPVEPTIPQSAASLFSRQQLENNRFLKQSLIDMSSTTALLQLVRSADLKKYHQTPLDLTSSSNVTANGPSSNNNNNTIKKDSSCCYSQEVTAILNWSVDDVCRFVSSIDLCKEYVDSFRSQCIDGSGLPLLTEEHLIAMGMKLGPALKFLSVLKRKLGNCIVCQHCPQCHNHNGANREPNHGFTANLNNNNNNIIQ